MVELTLKMTTNVHTIDQDIQDTETACQIASNAAEVDRILSIFEDALNTINTQFNDLLYKQQRVSAIAFFMKTVADEFNFDYEDLLSLYRDACEEDIERIRQIQRIPEQPKKRSHS